MNRREKKNLLGIIGIILVIIGITGTIPSSLQRAVVALGIFIVLGIVGIVLAIYGFSD